MPNEAPKPLDSEAGGEAMELVQALIRRRSISPQDDGCQDLLLDRLRRLGFRATPLHAAGVSNFYAEFGAGRPSLAFAGHTDVVPPGELSEWRSPPFAPTVRDGFLFGRGAADMKSSLAAMVVATERFLADHPEPVGRLSFLVTSDEEGEARFGTRRIVEHLRRYKIPLDYCVIGEPSSGHRLGDTLRHGRRGSLNGALTVQGVQGHVAYPELAQNPIHSAAPFLKELVGEVFDQGNAHFPRTSLQISSIAAGAGAANVIPGQLKMDFNLRYSSEQTAAGLKARVAALLQKHRVEGTLRWQLSGEPFLTPPGRLTKAVQAAVAAELGVQCRLSTAGGTSDGRFIAPLGGEVVELGPVNSTIHKVNECIAIADLDGLVRVYQRILSNLLAP